MQQFAAIILRWIFRTLTVRNVVVVGTSTTQKLKSEMLCGIVRQIISNPDHIWSWFPNRRQIDEHESVPSAALLRRVIRAP